jgi:hypothetical protein
MNIGVDHGGVREKSGLQTGQAYIRRESGACHGGFKREQGV